MKQWLFLIEIKHDVKLSKNYTYRAHKVIYLETITNRKKSAECLRYHVIKLSAIDDVSLSVHWTTYSNFYVQSDTIITNGFLENLPWLANIVILIHLFLLFVEINVQFRIAFQGAVMQYKVGKLRRRYPKNKRDVYNKMFWDEFLFNFFQLFCSLLNEF